MSFRLKLLLSMVLLVVGITATTLLITGGQVRLSYERHFQQSFRTQVDFFLRQREARLEPVKERVKAAAASTRLFAAIENAGQEHPEQRDIDDLYQNGLDQLSEVMAMIPGGRTNRLAGYFLFLNTKGDVLYPSPQAKLPFSLLGLRRIARQIEGVGVSVSRGSEPQIGYLAPEDRPGAQEIREMVFTPIVDQVGHRILGVLAVGFPLANAYAGASMLSALWLDNQLYSSSIPANSLPALEQVVRNEMRSGATPRHNFTTRLGVDPYQVYCEALITGPSFPPAYQVCLYSLAEASAEKRRFTQKILFTATVASLGALALSWLISRSLSVPLQELVNGTAEIERGNYLAKVVVRTHDELGRLGHAFNAMVDQIRTSYAALERRIAERTHELAERKRAEEALRKSEASLREAQRIARLGNWEWNVTTNELSWSDEIYAIFGINRLEFSATYESFLERVHPADREKVKAAVQNSLEAGRPYTLEHRMVRPDGETRIVREQAEIVRDDTRQTTRMVGTVQDVTEQKRIEAEFLRAQRMDGIGAIAGGMAHDLNNALAPILIGIQLIRKRVAEAEVREMLTVMESNTHRGAEMVRQVLTFARGRDLEREQLELGGIIREMQHILRQTIPKSIKVQDLIATDLWPVLGNATQLHQALLNLCVNARDAMPQGGKLILAADNVELNSEEAKEIPGGRPGSYVMLLVSDTGTGIPPDVLPRIFDTFFTTKPPGKGTGLGLSTTARIVRNHSGFLGVKSDLGTGTTFEIYLPRAETAPTAPGRETEESTALRTGRGELILFVDDDRAVREMVAPTLREQGYRVVTAADGSEALAYAEQHQRDLRLVIADIDMPVTNGLALTETLHSRVPHLPVVLMSGTVENSAGRVFARTCGFLTKPFRLEQLLTVIAKSLQASADHNL